MLGLGAVELLFCVPLAFRLFKLVITPRGPAAAKKGDVEEGRRRASTPMPRSAAIWARKAAAGEAMPEAPAAFPRGDAPVRPVFGRKIG